MVLLIVACTLVAYFPVWHAGFVWDDDLHITKNPFVTSFAGLQKIWFSSEAPQYYPLVFTSFSLEYALWGANPTGYHWTNIFIHTGSALVLWRLLRQLRIPGAALAALIFAVHPVNVESVAWISERKNVLCMFFYLLSVWCFARANEPEIGEQSGGVRLPPAAFYSVSVVCFVLALLSKTAVAPLPFVLLAFAWWRRGQISAKDLLKTVPFFVAAIALAIVTVWIERLKTGVTQSIQHEDFLSHLSIAGRAIWFYFYKAILPFGLNYIYPRWSADGSNLLGYLPGVMLVVIGFVLWRFRNQWGRAGLFCFIYYVLMLGPILGFVHVGFMDYSRVADHWQYFAIIGPITLAAAWLAKNNNAAPQQFEAGQLFRRNIAPVLIVLGLCALTCNASARFQNTTKLWSATVAGNPSAWIAHHQLGIALVGDGHVEEAIEHFKIALQQEADYPAAEVDLGNALLKLGRGAEAKEHFITALRSNPNLPEAHNNLSNLFARERDGQSALEQSLAAIRLRPNWAEPHYNAGNAYFLQNKFTEAAAEYSEALKLKPEYLEARQNLAFALEKAGRDTEAVTQYKELIHSRPDFAVAYHRLAIVLGRLARFDEAVRTAEEGMRLATAERQAGLASQLQENLARFRNQQPAIEK